uniref:Uncharacterized protein LOC100368829 n=1 Tax=Saccoglossus kowalevskii TaxID=10224 RepID=A0ABM0M5I9_SACKO|nr:PREDICTED: uncharacterized protein LOC100368829 [Saccoglossus kowalevskii]
MSYIILSFMFYKPHVFYFFLRTQLFLEYKLCKLLVRSLEDRGPSRQSSRSVYGYSRQTTSFASSSLGNSHPRSTYDNESEVSEPWASEINRSGILGRYLKPGSRAQSVPSYVPLGLYTSNVSANLSSNQNSSGHFSSKSRRAKSGSAIRSGKHEVDNDVNSYQPVSDSGVATTAPDHVTREGTQFTMETHSDGSGGKKSALRTPNSRYSQKKHTTIRIPHIDDQICNSNEKNEENAGHERKSVGNNNLATLPDNEDYVFGDTEKAPSFVEFDDDPEEYISDVQTEADLREMESRHKRTFQQLKEDMLGSIAGMEAFNEFLRNTVGMDMLNFWLDCEKYRDNVKAIGDAESTMKRNRLFRDIQDKYKFKLSDDAKEHIKKAQENEGLSETVFTRTQYDILRRMRTYWVPRFLIHQERHSEFRMMDSFKKFLTEDEENAALNKLTMHQDIDIYLRLPDAHTEKRNTQMKHIIATYFTESSKKSVNLPPEVMQNLAKEGDKPKNSTLQLVQKSVQPEIEEQFKVFWANIVQ